MKQYSISIVLLLVCLSFIFMSCKKDSETTQTPCDMHRKYLLIDVRANLPIDVNLDGIENIDLTKEIDAFRDCYIYFTDEMLTVAWPEARVGQYPITPNMPIVYTIQDIQHIIVPRYYTYDYGIDGNYARVYPTEIQEKGQQTYYRLFPTWIEVDKKQNIIIFRYADQNFLTEEGSNSRQLTAVFKPDPADGYSR